MLFTTHNYQDGKKKTIAKKAMHAWLQKKATIVHVKTDPEGLM